MGESLLRDVRQHSVGTAEGNHRRLAEKEALVKKGVICA